jgi:hypothetical protein
MARRWLADIMEMEDVTFHRCRKGCHTLKFRLAMNTPCSCEVMVLLWLLERMKTDNPTFQLWRMAFHISKLLQASFIPHCFGAMVKLLLAAITGQNSATFRR